MNASLKKKKTKLIQKSNFNQRPITFGKQCSISSEQAFVLMTDSFAKDFSFLIMSATDVFL